MKKNKLILLQITFVILIVSLINVANSSLFEVLQIFDKENYTSISSKNLDHLKIHLVISLVIMLATIVLNALVIFKSTVEKKKNDLLNLIAIIVTSTSFLLNLILTFTVKNYTGFKAEIIQVYLTVSQLATQFQGIFLAAAILSGLLAGLVFYFKISDKE